MADYSGRKVAFGFSSEAVRGTQAASQQAWIPHLEQDFGDKQEEINNESGLGVLDKNNDTILTKEWAEGKFSNKVQSNNVGWLLKAAFGTVSSGAVVSGTYTHTFSRNNANQGATLTIFKNSPNETLAYVMSVVSSMDIEAVVGDYVKLSTSFISKKGVTQALTPAYSVEAEIEFTAKHIGVYLGDYGDSEATILATTPVPLKSVKIALDRMAEPYFEMGSRTPTEIHTKGFDASLEIEKRFSDLTYKALSQSDTKKAMIVKMINTDQVIGSAQNPSLQFYFPKVSINSHEIKEGLEDITEESFKVQALFDTTSGKQCEAKLVNIVVSYPGV